MTYTRPLWITVGYILLGCLSILTVLSWDALSKEIAWVDGEMDTFSKLAMLSLGIFCIAWGIFGRKIETQIKE